MVQFIVEGEQSKFFFTTIKFESPEQAEELKKNPDLFILDWLAEKGYSKELGEVLLKTMFPALLSDFCHFVYESLSCSRKSKLTVANALLRKPLLENLHYLEWMLADPEGLLNTFYNQPSRELSFHNIRSSPEKMTNIIQKAIDRTTHREIYNAGYLYDIRFNKQIPFGFDVLCNKAMHLITTKEGLTTEDQNFNFVFSGDDERHIQWTQIYSTLPFLLFYALDICESLMALMAKEIPNDLAVVSLHRTLGFILWGYELNRFANPQHDEFTPPELLVLECPKCNRQIQTNETIIGDLFSQRKLKCPHCHKVVKLPQFVKST
jgi:hypothetical protein